MCWLCNINKFKIQRAEEDIVVYKILQEYPNGELRSPHYDYFPYTLNTTYHSPINIVATIWNNENVESTTGLYSNLEIPICDEYLGVKSYSFKCGGSYPVAEHFVVKCVIPKNSFYSIGKYKEVISNTLKPIAIGKLVDNKIFFDNVI